MTSRGESCLRRTVACRASYKLNGFNTAATPRLFPEEEGAKLPSKMIQCVQRQLPMPTRGSAEFNVKTYSEQVLKTNEEEKNLAFLRSKCDGSRCQSRREQNSGRSCVNPKGAN